MMRRLTSLRKARERSMSLMVADSTATRRRRRNQTESRNEATREVFVEVWQCCYLILTDRVLLDSDGSFYLSNKR